MENPTLRDSDSDSDTNTSEKCDSNRSPDGALSTAEAQVAVRSSDKTFECSATSTPSKDKDRENASPVSLRNPIVKDSNSDSDSCESKPSPGDTGNTAVVEIDVCSSAETLKESSLSKTSEEKKEINGKNDYSMIKDNDGQPDDLSITAEGGGTSSKFPDAKDDPRTPATTTVSFFSNPLNYVLNKVRGIKRDSPKRPGKSYYSDALETQQVSPRKPGKPYFSEVSSDSIVLVWITPDSDDVDYYEIKYKAKDDKWCRTPVITDNNKPYFVVGGLLHNTDYIFKVRPHYRDGEGEFSDDSDPIPTPISPALVTRKKAIKIKDGEPAIYKLPLRENTSARNAKFRTRKCEFGSSEMLEDKTIMMIGATGSGKSTLIDGMMNYLLGVKWKDDFRFQLIDQMDDEKARKGKETESQTDWITSYRVHPKNDKVKFICNLIDTPGFADTRGIERDHQLVDQIRAFFGTKGVKGIETIDAVCFVTQAPLARLNHIQRYIYDSILSIFGKDIRENIAAMVTFADGKEPPVLEALRQAEVPLKEHFLFNNSALFEENTSGKSKDLGKMFWDMGYNSYQQFFTFLSTMQTQSLQLTTEVLRKRDKMNVTIAGLLPQIDQGLHELANMRKERELLEKFKREIEDNKDFEYETEEIHQRKEKLEPGTHVTNCTTCNYTCHDNCGINNDNKYHCSSMRKGYCTVCPKKCRYDVHRNNQFRIITYKKKVKKSYTDMKQKYDSSKKGKSTKESLILGIKAKVLATKDKVVAMVDEIRICGNYIREFAIKSNPLTEVEYIDVQIESELKQKNPGFEDRVRMFKAFKRSAECKAKSIELSEEDFLVAMGFIVDDM